MKSFVKWTGIILVTILIVAVFSGTYLDIPRQELEEKYALGESKFVILTNDSRIHYRDEGNAQGPAIVLLHGFNGSLFNFERLVPLLVDDFRLVSIDLPAFGLTGAVPSANYTTENFMNTVLEVTTQLGIKKFSIAGNSMGGHTAWRYALQYPDQIETLILIAAAGVWTEEDLETASSDGPLIWKIMSSDLAKGVLLYFSPRFFSEQGLKTAVADPELVTENLVDQFHQLALMQGSRKAFISMFSDERGDWANPEIFRNITAPTLVIHGSEDNLLPVETSEHFVENIPVVEVRVYKGIGHLPMYEDPQRTSKDIRDFLNRYSKNYVK